MWWLSACPGTGLPGCWFRVCCLWLHMMGAIYLHLKASGSSSRRQGQQLLPHGAAVRIRVLHMAPSAEWVPSECWGVLQLLLTSVKYSKDTDQKNESLSLEEERKYVCGLTSFYLSQKTFFFKQKTFFIPCISEVMAFVFILETNPHCLQTITAFHDIILSHKMARPCWIGHHLGCFRYLVFMSKATVIFVARSVRRHDHFLKLNSWKNF